METVTTVTTPGDGTIVYTSEDGTTTVIDIESNIVTTSSPGPMKYGERKLQEKEDDKQYDDYLDQLRRGNNDKPAENSE